MNVGLFEHLADTDQSERVAQRKALSVAQKRVQDKFGKFLELAEDSKGRRERLALVEDEFSATIKEAAKEYGGDPEKIESAIRRHIASPLVGDPGGLSGHGCFTCGNELEKVGSKWVCPTCDRETEHASPFADRELQQGVKKDFEDSYAPGRFAKTAGDGIYFGPGAADPVEGYIECPSCGYPDAWVDENGDEHCRGCGFGGDSSEDEYPPHPEYDVDENWETHPFNRHKPTQPTLGSLTKEAPGKKHLPGASDKRNRQYEHIKDSYLEEGESEDEAKELAARTVNKQRAEHGETKEGGIYTEGEDPVNDIRGEPLSEDEATATSIELTLNEIQTLAKMLDPHSEVENAILQKLGDPYPDIDPYSDILGEGGDNDGPGYPYDEPSPGINFGGEAGSHQARIARRPKLCPYHSEVVDISLSSDDPRAGYDVMASHAWGSNHCQGEWEGSCKFQREMVTNTYWDEKAKAAEDRKRERDEQAQFEPSIEPVEDSLDAQLEEAPSAVADEEGFDGVEVEISDTGEISEPMAVAASKKEAIETPNHPWLQPETPGGPMPAGLPPLATTPQAGLPPAPAPPALQPLQDQTTSLENIVDRQENKGPNWAPDTYNIRHLKGEPILGAADRDGGGAVETVDLPAGDDSALDGPSPEMDKSKSGDERGWILDDIDTETSGTPHPTEVQDPADEADHTNRKFLDQTDAVTKQETLPSDSENAGFTTEKNIEQQKTKTFPRGPQTAPVTSSEKTAMGAWGYGPFDNDSALDAIHPHHPDEGFGTGTDVERLVQKLLASGEPESIRAAVAVAKEVGLALDPETLTQGRNQIPDDWLNEWDDPEHVRGLVDDEFRVSKLDPEKNSILQMIEEDFDGFIPEEAIKQAKLAYDEGGPTNEWDCDCGHHMQRFRGVGDQQCPKCGTEYNASGQKLAPRSQWGEETGESYADIYGPDPESLGYPYE